jgi:glycerol-3-phosphate dehydrogenase
MLRDSDRLTASTFDVLVVGGGIYGLTIAYDAAQRGLSVALIERADFGSGSSFNHLRTIHGGLRYLQTLNIRRARESILERRTLARIAPHAVQSLPFVLPLFRSLTRGPLAMRAGFMLDQVLACDRNRGVPPHLRIPAGRVVSRQAAIERFPRLQRDGLTSAAIWHDYVTPESDRLTFTWAVAAAEHGAVLANYVEAMGLLHDGRRVVGVRAANHRDGREIEIGARVTVNATGGSVDGLLTESRASTGIPLLKAMNLVTRHEGGESALGGRSASGRHLFLVPWRNRAIFGTWESARPCTAGQAVPTEAEIGAFINEINEAFPSLALERGDVTLVHYGAVPAVVANGRIALQGHEQVRDHAEQGIDGIVSVAGVKYTTARAVAEHVTDTVVTKLQRPAAPCRTAVTPLPGGDLLDIAAELATARREHRDLSSSTMSHLMAAYGSRYRHVLELAAGRTEWRATVTEESSVIGAELVWAVRHEMALTLNDAVVRRTPLGALGYPGDAAAQRAAAILGAELGWSDEQRGREVATLRAFYRVPLAGC